MTGAVPLLLMRIPLQGATQQSVTALLNPTTSCSIQKHYPHTGGVIAYACCVQDPIEEKEMHPL